MEMKRGAVIAGLYNAHITGQKATVRPIPLDPNLMRASLLYWDRIDIPDSDVATIRIPKEFDTLQKEGIVSRKLVKSGLGHLFSLGGNLNITLSGNTLNGQPLESNLINSINQAPLRAFQELVEDTDVLWSYFQNSSTVSVPSGTGSSGRSLLFEIYNALPVPDPDTPIDNILSFKDNRKSELLSLRYEIDSAYQKISNATDIEYAKSMELSKLKSALLDLEKVANETFLHKLRNSLKFEINLVGIATPIAALALDAPIVIGAAIGIGSCFKLDCSNVILGPRLPDRLTPYQYLLDVQTKL